MNTQFILGSFREELFLIFGFFPRRMKLKAAHIKKSCCLRHYLYAISLDMLWKLMTDMYGRLCVDVRL